MLLCFKHNALLKMTVLSVIFFGATACNESKIKQTPSEISTTKYFDYFSKDAPNDFINRINHPLERYAHIPNTFSPNYLSINALDYENRHYVINEKTSDLYNLIQLPESKNDYSSLTISILALLASIFLPIFLHKKQKKDAINDGFWLREVILPKINDLMFQVCSDLKSNFNLSPADFGIQYQSLIIPKINELRDKFEMLDSFPKMQNYLDALDDHCDQLDNDVSNHITSPPAIRMNDISTFNRSMLKTLIEIHKAI